MNEMAPGVRNCLVWIIYVIHSICKYHLFGLLIDAYEIWL